MPGPAAPGAGQLPRVGAARRGAVCALVLAESRLRAGTREPVLALARPVAAGQVITAADLRVVGVSAAGPVSLVPAWRQAQVTGRTATASLPAGSLLAAGDIGAPSPGRGRAWLGVALKPGRYPPGLSPGQHVGVLAAPGGRAPARVAGCGVVLSVTTIPGPGAAVQTVAVLDLPRDVVPRVAAAAAAGRVSLAVIPAGR
jgi:Flp pilus assembly protein CpaB